MKKIHKKWLILGVLLAVALLIFMYADRSFSFENLSENAVSAIDKIAPELKEDPSKQLQNPPKVIKAIYSTAWSAGNADRIEYFLDLINSTELNALVVDIKDYSGVVSYKPDVEQVIEYDAFENRISDIDEFIETMHENDVYLIARISTFQDDKLAAARPDLALQSKASGGTWGDRKNVHWMDTSSKEVWDYNIAIAKDILDRGFDEVNFDYIRFATDGNINDIHYPFYNEITPKHEVIKEFLAYTREQLPDEKISADLFGLVTVNYDDLGIGQVLEDAFPVMDAVAPMTYPSHYAHGFNGIADPAAHPYEIMKYSIDVALKRLDKLYQPKIVKEQTTNASGTIVYLDVEKPAPIESFEVLPTLRPWIQDFDLGADYTAEMVRAQIKAIEDSARVYSGCASLEAGPECSKYVSGWMIWAPSNWYTEGALKPNWKEPVTTNE